MKAKLETKEDLEKKGQAKGKLVMMAPAEDEAAGQGGGRALHGRRAASATLGISAIPAETRAWPSATPEFRKRRAVRGDGSIAAVIKPGNGEGGVFLVQAFRYVARPAGVPPVVLTAEHYDRIVRLLDKKIR